MEFTINLSMKQVLLKLVPIRGGALYSLFIYEHLVPYDGSLINQSS